MPRNMSFMLTTEKFTRIPLQEVIKVPNKSGTYHLVTNSYWAISEDDCILLYKGFSRQCNVYKDIVERIIKSKEHPGVKVKFLKSVFLPHRCEDYI